MRPEIISPRVSIAAFPQSQIELRARESRPHALLQQRTHPSVSRQGHAFPTSGSGRGTKALVLHIHLGEAFYVFDGATIKLADGKQVHLQVWTARG
jgi:hypothetical protein